MLYIVDVTFKEGRRATAHFREAYMADNAAQAMMDFEASFAGVAHILNVKNVTLGADRN